MIEFAYKKPAYYAGVINNSLGLRTLAKFDSGAAISIIGLERFGRELQDKLFVDFFINYTKDNSIDKKVYTAANEQEIETYPCMIDKISLNGTDIINFRFGLVLTQKSNRFLLGDDFISCCEFQHMIGGPILINNFSQSRYESSVSNTKLANLTVILSDYKKQHNNMI